MTAFQDNDHARSNAAQPAEHRVRHSSADAALLERIRQGDDQAVAALLACYSSRIDRFAVQLCGPSEDARDVGQQTRLAAFRGLSLFRGEASIGTWLFRIARSFCIKVRRLKQGQPSSWDSLEEVNLLHVQDTSLDPSEQLQDKQLADALKRALSHLSSSHLEVLQLKDVEGLSIEETARVLGHSVASVKSRLVRARGELRAALKSSDEEHARG